MSGHLQMISRFCACNIATSYISGNLETTKMKH